MSAKPPIPRSAWACFATGWITVALTVLIFLNTLDQIALPQYVPLGWLTFAAAIATFVLAALSLSAIKRQPGQWRGGWIAIWGMVLTVFCFVAVSFVLALCTLVYDAALRSQIVSRLYQIGLAFHTYYQEHHQLPPAAIRAADGRPLLSWRVALLPHINQEALYREFKLDEPWDSEHNRALLPRIPNLYRVPSDTRTPLHLTHLQVFVGPGTAFERDGLQLPKDFPDGVSNTILVAEAAWPVPWTQPADLVFDPAGPLPALGPAVPPGFRARKHGEFCVLTADGAVLQIYRRTPPFPLGALITRNGGEKLPDYWSW